MTEDGQFGTMVREALDAATPPAADARIRAAIRGAAAFRRRRRRVRAWAAAAALALLLGGGLWTLARAPGPQRAVLAKDDAALADEGEVMLEIIGMSEPVELVAFQIAQL